jgi:hypothetical protein
MVERRANELALASTNTKQVTIKAGSTTYRIPNTHKEHNIEELLGIEGAAALAYFQSFSGMLKTTGDDILDAIADGRIADGRAHQPVKAHEVWETFDKQLGDFRFFTHF